MPEIPTIILMTKWQAPGRGKTRLAKNIGIENAFLIQKKLIRHSLSVLNLVSDNKEATIKIAVSGIGEKKCKKIQREYQFAEITRQGPGNLGVKIKRELEKNRIGNHAYKSKRKCFTTIFIGTDLPDLTHLDLQIALHKLKSHDMVIGPSTDGGYWLVGFSSNYLSNFLIWPFCGINWGENNVFSSTIKKAKENKVNFFILNFKNDIDNINDLKPWVN